MKRFGWMLCMVFLGLLVLGWAHAERGMTVMVYMCGSNLESGYGAATGDLMEMRDARLDSRETAVLVMTGGSKNWAAGFDSDLSYIHEVSRKGIRTVWTGEIMNMGESGTLTHLLKWGRENYPAREYALIFWDHGAGPMEGLCWDEKFSMDHLSLEELRRALEAAEMPERMSFVGFDACLMSSLEVASAMKKYARYMIASQETEPATGWDYSFLKEIGADRDGADTGRRIADLYIASAGNRDMPTLACIDLDRIEPVIEELDRLFSRAGGSMTEETYAVFSAARSRSSAFGRSISMLDSQGYDLVDLGDFAARLEGGEALTEALGQAVVYRAGWENGASGLSIYHPYQNGRGYLDSWREAYDGMKVSSGYARYLRMFGMYLTGEQLCRWTDLVPEKKEDAGRTYMLPLTAEQSENVTGARMLVLRSLRGKAGKDIFVLLNTLPVRRAQGGLEGDYSPEKLYARLENGKLLGPVSVAATDDDRYLMTVGMYDRDMEGAAGHAEGGASAVFQLETPLVPGEVHPVSTLVYDEATHQFTSRIPLREEDYARVVLWNIDRMQPGEQMKELPAFREWESYSGFMSWSEIPLPQTWEFVCLEEDMAVTDVYVAFEITDLQQRVWCSRPIQVKNDEWPEFRTDAVEMEETGIRLSGQIREAAQESGLYLSFEVENTGETPRDYQIEHVVFNGSREIRGKVSLFGVESGGNALRDLQVNPKDLYGMETVASIEAEVKWTQQGTWDWSEGKTVRFSVSNFDVSRMAWQEPALARTQEDGVEYVLLSLTGNGSYEVEGEMLVRNGTGAELNPDEWILLPENLQMERYSSLLSLEDGRERVISFTLQDRLKAYEFETGLGEAFGDAVLTGSLLKERAQGSIRELRIVTGFDQYEGKIGKDVRIRLEKPWNVPEDWTGEEGCSQILVSDGALLVEAVRVNAAAHTAALGLALTNRGPAPLHLRIQDGQASSREVPVKLGMVGMNGMLLLPGSTRFVSAVFTDVEEPELSDLGFSILCWGRDPELTEEGMSALSLFGEWVTWEELLEGGEGVPPETIKVRLSLDEPEVMPEDRWLSVPGNRFSVSVQP